MLITVTTIPPGTFAFSAFLAGDTAIFKQIFQQYYRSLFRYANHLIYDHAMAEEIVADAFVKLYRHRAGIESPLHLRNFLYTCTRHDCITGYHQQQRRHRQLQTWTTTEPDFDDPFDDTQAIDSSRLQWLFTQADRLPPICARIFRLFFLENKTIPEIAQALHIHPQTVRNQKTRAIMLLRKALSNRYDRNTL